MTPKKRKPLTREGLHHSIGRSRTVAAAMVLLFAWQVMADLAPVRYLIFNFGMGLSASALVCFGWRYRTTALQVLGMILLPFGWAALLITLPAFENTHMYQGISLLVMGAVMLPAFLSPHYRHWCRELELQD